MDLGVLWDFAGLLPGSVLVEHYIGMQLGPSDTHPGPSEAATNYGSICDSKQVAHSGSQAVLDIDLHESPSQEASKPTHQVADFRPHQNITQIAPQVAYPIRDLSSHKTLLGQILLCGVSPHTAACTLWLELILIVSQAEG